MRYERRRGADTPARCVRLLMRGHGPEACSLTAEVRPSAAGDGGAAVVLPITCVAGSTPGQQGKRENSDVAEGVAMAKKETSTSRTATPTQSRSWILTISADKHDRDEVETALEPYKYVGQLERGEGGFVHWQVLIENETPIRFATLKRKLPTAHIEPRRGSVAEAVAYCTKEDSRVDGEAPLEHGAIPVRDEKGQRSDLDRIRSAILDEGRSVDEVILTMPEAARVTRYVSELAAARDRAAVRGVERDVEVTYLYGDPGVGKTRWLYDHYDNVARLTDYRNFDSYNGETVLALDEYGGQIDLRLLNAVLDRYPINLPARYYDRPARYENVVIISNQPPWALYDWEQPVVRRAFARRLHRVLMMDARGIVHEVDRDSVQSRFGVVNRATPVAALESVPAVNESEESALPATLPLRIKDEQPPF